MKKSILPYIFTVLGIALIAGGIIILKVVGEPQGVLMALPYVMILSVCVERHHHQDKRGGKRSR